MKNITKILFLAIMAIGMFACGEKKLTENDLVEAEKTLFNDDMTANAEAVPAVVTQFCKFAEQNPDCVNAPEWLFKALEISVNYLDAEKTIEIGNQLIENYPEFEKTPVGMFILGSFVYEDKLHDLDKAREMYERILAEYPDSEFVPSVEASLRNLGKTPEELIQEFEQQMQVDSVAEE